MEDHMNLINQMSKDLALDKSIHNHPVLLVNNIQASYQQQYLSHLNNLSLYLLQDSSLETFLVQLKDF